MQILTSRSTVVLEDRQVIEQLIFTARELAATAARTAGFENTGESNQRLGLEMWEGAAYTCRPSEEVTIKNIFLCNFLERLGEIVRTAPPTVAAAALVRRPTEILTDPQSPPVADYEIPVDEPSGEVGTSYADECVPECEREGGEEALVESADESDLAPIELTADQLPESNEPEVVEVPVVAMVPVPGSPMPAEAISRSTAEAGVPAIESIVLSENEPYRFESCTVTVVLQILPADEGNRKCIISIRTHDFTPHIETASLSGNFTAGDLAVTLGSAIEKYRNDLPVRAADKLKRQAAAGKKALAKPASSLNLNDQKAAPANARKAGDLAPVAVGSQQAGLFGG